MFWLRPFYCHSRLGQSEPIIASQEGIDDFTASGSPGDIVMHHFKIADECKMAQWAAHKLAVEEGASCQQQSAQALVGKQRKGKQAARSNSIACRSLRRRHVLTKHLPIEHAGLVKKRKDLMGAPRSVPSHAVPPEMPLLVRLRAKPEQGESDAEARVQNHSLTFMVKQLIPGVCGARNWKQGSSSMHVSSANVTPSQASPARA